MERVEGASTKNDNDAGDTRNSWYRHNHLETLRRELNDFLSGGDGVRGPQMECVDLSEIRYRLARAWARSHMPIIRSRNSK